jgi:endonuclease/exonuclease/phosphatase (EEP) superfamily protein YafD
VWITFDIFNHFLLHFALAALAFAVALRLPRHRMAAAAATMLVGVVAIGVWPRLASREAPVPKQVDSGRVVRVMSFNTWLVNDDWQAIAAEIRREDPDVVALIEFGGEKAEALASLSAVYPFRSECAQVMYCHLAVLSKFPFESAETKIQWRGPPQIVVRFGPELSGLTLVGIHSIRPPHFASQLLQMNALARQLRQIGGTQIVLGDFNSTPFSRMLSEFLKRSGLERLTYLPSWPSRFGSLPQIAIDHIFLSRDLSPAGAARIGESAGSDHYPVIADIKLPPAPRSASAREKGEDSKTP